jgi:hypothetical protein
LAVIFFVLPNKLQSFRLRRIGVGTLGEFLQRQEERQAFELQGQIDALATKTLWHSRPNWRKVKDRPDTYGD